MPTEPLPEGYGRYYTYTAKVSHVIDIDRHRLISPLVAALCGRTPNYPWIWLGHHSRAEQDRAQDQPMCKLCAGRLVDKIAGAVPGSPAVGRGRARD